MSPKTFTLISLMAFGALTTTGCVAPKLTDSEQEMVETLTGSRFQPATRTERDNIETQDLLAQAAFWSREYNLNPADLESNIKLAATVRKMGNPGRAVEITQTARALHPRDPYLLAEYGAALIAANRGAEAIEPLDLGLQTAPGYARLWSLKGAALDQRENYDLARKHYARALQITPYDPNILANIGLSYALSGDAETAEGWLRRAVSIPGASASVKQNLAIVLQLQGKEEDVNQIMPAPRQAELALPSLPPANVTAPRANTVKPQNTAPRTRAPVARQAYPSAPQAQPHLRAPVAPQTRQQPRIYGAQNNTGLQTQPNPNRAQGYAVKPQTATAPAPSRAPAQNSAPSTGYQTNPVLSLRGARSHISAPTAAPAPIAPQIQTRIQGAPQAAINNINNPEIKTASDAARAAAQASARHAPRRQVVAPAQQTAEQQAILQQLARNVGPKARNLTPPPHSRAGAPQANPAGNYPAPYPNYIPPGQYQAPAQQTAPQYTRGPARYRQ